VLGGFGDKFEGKLGGKSDVGRESWREKYAGEKQMRIQ
jgi:hypothetical protein